MFASIGANNANNADNTDLPHTIVTPLFFRNLLANKSLAYQTQNFFLAKLKFCASWEVQINSSPRSSGVSKIARERWNRTLVNTKEDHWRLFFNVMLKIMLKGIRGEFYKWLIEKLTARRFLQNKDKPYLAAMVIFAVIAKNPNVASLHRSSLTILSPLEMAGSMDLIIGYRHVNHVTAKNGTITKMRELHRDFDGSVGKPLPKSRRWPWNSGKESQKYHLNNPEYQPGQPLTCVLDFGQAGNIFSWHSHYNLYINPGRIAEKQD